MEFGVFDHVDRSGTPLRQFFEERIQIARDSLGSSIRRAKDGAIRALDRIPATMSPPETYDPSQSDPTDDQPPPARPRRAPRRPRRSAPGA